MVYAANIMLEVRVNFSALAGDGTEGQIVKQKDRYEWNEKRVGSTKNSRELIR